MSIRMMATEREALAQFLPGLQKELSAHRLLDLEARDSEVLTMFKNSDAPALVAPRDWGGLGASALEATRVQRAIGALIEDSAGGEEEREPVQQRVAARMVVDALCRSLQRVP